MHRWLILLLPLLVVLLSAPAQGQSDNRAGIVVQFGDGSVVTRCVSFAEEQITGVELLQRSGLEVIAQASGVGAAVCKIGGDGCDYPAESCFCNSGGGQPTRYWAYWQLRDGAWQYASQGAHATRVADGDVDGWAWGGGSAQTGAQPPLIPFGQICAVNASATTSLPQATRLPTIDPSPPAVAASPTMTQVTQPIAPSDPSSPSDDSSGGTAGSYIIFGVLLVGVLGAIGVALRRR